MADARTAALANAKVRAEQYADGQPAWTSVACCGSSSRAWRPR